MSISPLAQQALIEEQTRKEREIEARRTAIIESTAEALAALAQDEFAVRRFGSRAYSDEAARRHSQEGINAAEHRIGDLASERFHDWYSDRDRGKAR